MRNKNVWRGMFLVCSVVFTCALCLMMGKKKEGQTDENNRTNITGELKSKVEVKIDNEIFAVHLWDNKEDDKRYLFLPGYLKEEYEKSASSVQDADTRLIDLSDIPTLYIETETGAFDAVKESKENREKVSISLWEKDRGVVEKKLPGIVKARGNASFYAPQYKKSYTIKLEENKEILGMPGDREWVLLAHYYDDTHLRDYLTFDMAERLEMDYVPQGRFVNLYVDGNFEGIYFFCEKIGIASERIDITNLEETMKEKIPASILKKYPYAREGVRGGQNVIIEKGFVVHEGFEDITGGYLLELEWLKDRYNEEKSGFTSDGNQCVVIKSPEYATNRQISYIKNYYQQFENALKKSMAEDTEEYMAYIDLDSFVNKYLVEEVSKNMDANMSSQYIYKDIDAVDTKFYAGPVWDYDRAYDNKVGDINNRGADIFWVNKGSAGFDFWKKLYEMPSFEKRVREIYKEKLSDVLTEYADCDIWKWEQEIHDSVIADMFRYQSEYEIKMDEEARLLEEMNALAEFIRDRKVFLDREWAAD